MLNSKEILERTGISRATLNNYIAAGLVPRPDVLPPGPNDGDAPRLGYFPDDTVERVETIQRLKREGWSLGRIVEYFARGSEEAVAPSVAAQAPAIPRSSPLSASVQDSKEVCPIDPQIMVVAVLAVALHDADGLWVTLSVHDYFELSSELESEIRRLVHAGKGQAVRLAPYRFVCSFLPHPDSDALGTALAVAQSVRLAVGEMNARWKLRRGWDLDILINAGLAVGEAWVSGKPTGEFQVVGDVAGDAQQLARHGSRGALLISRDFVARLPHRLRDRLVYGVPPVAHQSVQADGAAAPARLMTFTRLRSFGGAHGVPRRIADIPVTELIEFRDDGLARKDEK